MRDLSRNSTAAMIRPGIITRDLLPFGSCRARRTDEIVYLVGTSLEGLEALFEVIAFASGREYLGHTRRDKAACLILDLQLPDMSGLDLQAQLAGNEHLPVIFVSHDCDIPSAVRAMKAGALEFFTAPVDPSALVDAIRAALAQDRASRQTKAELEALQKRYCLLTPREKEVLPLLAGGLLNKQAACILGVTEVTLQVHRGQIMRKMQAESFAELVRMAVTLGIPYREVA